MAADKPRPFHPKDAISSTIETTLLTGGIGFFASAVQNTLQKQNVGALGVFTKTGGTIALFGTLLQSNCFLYLGRILLSKRGEGCELRLGRESRANHGDIHSVHGRHL